MKLYLRILSYGKPFFSNGVMAFFFLLLYNLFGIFSLALVIPFLEILFNQNADGAAYGNGEGLKDMLYAKMDQIISQYDKMDVLIGFCLVLGTSIFLKNLFRYLSSYNIAPLEQGVINNMRKTLFRHLSRLSMPFFSGEQKGKVINILVSDVQIIQESVIGTIQNVISDPMAMLMVLGTMFAISWKLTLFSLVVLPLTGYFISRIAKSLKKRARSSQELLGEQITVMDEFISGIRIVKAFGSEEYERERYRKMNDGYQTQMIGLKRRNDLASPLTEVLSIFVVITIILYGGSQIIGERGNLRPSEFIAFIALFSQFLAPIKTFSSAISRIQRGIVSFQRVEEFLAIEETVQEKENPVRVSDFEDKIAFEEVSFRYEEEEVLKKVSFEVKKGESVALVGPSGGGKSTLADLVPRFYDPESGKITLDGHSLTDLSVMDLRGMIGVVTQEGILFNDTVARNIAYGDEKVDMARVREAARIAHADGFITEMPQGYETTIGERGTKLSGGQRQRLSIARAIYKNAPILILDEATSALDSESERLVQEALDEVMKGRTSIIIAHRLSTIRNADKILVIDRGEVVESGTHPELLALEGMYFKLWSLQVKENPA